MGVTRILDLIVLLLLATVILIPRPDATVKPALAVDPELRARVAELQSGLIGRPDDADGAVELANIYLDGHRPDWALATVGAAQRFHPTDYRLYHLRAIAFADRFDGEPASEAAARALSLCQQTPPPPGGVACGPAAESRLALLASTLAAVAKVDMKKQPYLAKDRIFEQLHPTFIPKPRTKPPAPAAAAAKKPPAP